jgi:hypothetical protein
MTIEITGYNYEGQLGMAHVKYSLTEAEAAMLPKWLRLCATPEGQRYNARIKFTRDAANGGANEAGVRRLNKLFSLGATYKDCPHTSNAYRSKDDFDAAIDQHMAAA